MKKLPKLIVILGPTASGKTDLAIKLAKKFNGEIVNADSRNIYRGMFIGTASPFTKAQKSQSRRFATLRGGHESKKTKAEQNIILNGAKDLFVNGIKHHLFHFINPWETYSVGQYKKDAIKVINDIIKRGKMPILVGGTGLYIWAVVDNLEIPEVPSNQKLRKQFEAFITKARTSCCPLEANPPMEDACPPRTFGCGGGRGSDLKTSAERLNHLWVHLLKFDPKAASFVQKDNPRRIIRALEVILTVNKSPKRVSRLRQRFGLDDTSSIIKFSELRRQGQPLYNVLQIGIKMPHSELYKRIEARVQKQIKQGLVGETKRACTKIAKKTIKNDNTIKCRSALYRTRKVFSKYAKYFKIWSLPSMTALGYRQIGMYLRGEAPLEEAIRILKRDTRRYARRQMTWFRRDKRIGWVKSSDATPKIRKFLK